MVQESGGLGMLLSGKWFSGRCRLIWPSIGLCFDSTGPKIGEDVIDKEN